MANELKDTLEKLAKDRDKTVKAFTDLIESNQKIINNTDSTAEEIKKATDQNKKANAERKTLEKQQVTLAGDLKKNFSDIGTTITGGLEGMLSESFGPLGGIAASLTTGFFKRGQEAKKSLESDQMQVDTTDQLVEELGKKTGGTAEKVSAESAAETAGGVQDVGEGLDTTNLLLTDIEEHLQFMTDNMEDAETRRERMRALKAKKAGGTVAGGAGAGEKGMEDDGGGGGFRNT